MATCLATTSSFDGDQAAAQAATQEGGARTPTPVSTKPPLGRGRPRKTAREEEDLVVRLANVGSAKTATHVTLDTLSPSFSLVVPNGLLEKVYRSKGDYIRVFNDHIEGGVVQLEESSTRLRKCLEVKAGRLHSQLAKAGGSHKRTTILKKEAYLLVGKGEAINLRQYILCRGGCVHGTSMFEYVSIILAQNTTELCALRRPTIGHDPLRFHRHDATTQ